MGTPSTASSFGGAAAASGFAFREFAEEIENRRRDDTDRYECVEKTHDALLLFE